MATKLLSGTMLTVLLILLAGGKMCHATCVYTDINGATITPNAGYVQVKCSAVEDADAGPICTVSVPGNTPVSLVNYNADDPILPYIGCQPVYDAGSDTTDLTISIISTLDEIADTEMFLMGSLQCGQGEPDFLVIAITPVNDHDPSFNSSLYTIDGLNEAFPKNTDMLQYYGVSIVASDLDTPNDPSSAMSFSITAGNDDGAFGVQFNSDNCVSNIGCAIQLIIVGTLNYQVQSSYTLTIQVSDEGTPPRTGTTTVAVTIQDVDNLNPKFDSTFYSSTITDLNTGKYPLTMSPQPINAIDQDTGINAAIVYSPLFDNCGASCDIIAAAFSVDPQTGVITFDSDIDISQINNQVATFGIQASQVDNADRSTIAIISVYLPPPVTTTTSTPTTTPTTTTEPTTTQSPTTTACPTITPETTTVTTPTSTITTTTSGTTTTVTTCTTVTYPTESTATTGTTLTDSTSTATTLTGATSTGTPCYCPTSDTPTTVVTMTTECPTESTVTSSQFTTSTTPYIVTTNTGSTVTISLDPTATTTPVTSYTCNPTSESTTVNTGSTTVNTGPTTVNTGSTTVNTGSTTVNTGTTTVNTGTTTTSTGSTQTVDPTATTSSSGTTFMPTGTTCYSSPTDSTQTTITSTSTESTGTTSTALTCPPCTTTAATCEPCPTTLSTSTSSTSSMPTTSATCEPCPTATYMPTTSATCEPCPTTTYMPTTAATCEPCPTTTYVPTTLQTCPPPIPCPPLPQGTFMAEFQISVLTPINADIVDLTVADFTNPTYTMAGGDSSFAINQNGQISVTDYLSVKNYVLNVSATSPTKQEAITGVYINVIADNSIFGSNVYQIQVPENATSQNIMDLDTTYETDGASAYFIYSSDPTECQDSFEIDSMTGQLSSIDSLDYEQIRSCNLIIQVNCTTASNDPPTSSNSKGQYYDGDGITINYNRALILVNITDENDNPPNFQDDRIIDNGITLAISASTSSGQAVIQLHTTDADTDSINTAVSYAIQDTTDFYIDGVTGLLMAATPISKLDKNPYKFSVTADNNEQNSKLSITIWVLQNSQILVITCDYAVSDFEKNQDTILQELSSKLNPSANLALRASLAYDVQALKWEAADSKSTRAYLYVLGSSSEPLTKSQLENLIANNEAAFSEYKFETNTATTYDQTVPNPVAPPDNTGYIVGISILAALLAVCLIVGGAYAYMMHKKTKKHNDVDDFYANDDYPNGKQHVEIPPELKERHNNPRLSQAINHAAMNVDFENENRSIIDEDLLEEVVEVEEVDNHLYPTIRDDREDFDSAYAHETLHEFQTENDFSNDAEHSIPTVESLEDTREMLMDMDEEEPTKSILIDPNATGSDTLEELQKKEDLIVTFNEVPEVIAVAAKEDNPIISDDEEDEDDDRNDE